MGIPEPDPYPLPEPFAEPEKPWPIDPRPAWREFKQVFREPFVRRKWSELSRLEKRWHWFGFVALITLAITYQSINRLRYPAPLKTFITADQLAKISIGMPKTQVIEILGEPENTQPFCWSYQINDNIVVRIHFDSLLKVRKVQQEAQPIRDRTKRGGR